jgi:hypothetical protein
MIEEHWGFFSENLRRYHKLDAYRRVRVVEVRSRISYFGDRSAYCVTLEDDPGRSASLLPLGEYRDLDDALLVAGRAARALQVPLYDASRSSLARKIPWNKLDQAHDAAAQTGKWWQQPSVLALVAANLVPVAGVQLLDWDMLPVVMLFWSENLIVGLYTALKMLYCNLAEGLANVPFFIVHFGSFCMGHGIFLVMLFGTDDQRNGILQDLAGIPGRLFDVVLQAGLSIGIIALLASHGYSFYRNFIRGREYQRTTARKLMFAPYTRVVLLHVIIIAGGFVVLALGSPRLIVLMLVLAKIAVDIRAHLKEHRAALAQAYS